MPSEGYQFLNDAEIAALIAAIRATPKSGQEQPARSIGPLGRVGLLAGKFNTAPKLVADYRASPIPDLGVAVCPRPPLGRDQLRRMPWRRSQGEGSKAGRPVGRPRAGRAYDLDQFKALLRKGVAPGKKLRLMGEVARTDFKNINDDEIAAIHAYLAERAKRTP